MTLEYLPISWPLSTSHQWWWMRCRTTRRSQWRVLLVEVVERGEQEFVKPFKDRNCYSRFVCQDWEASFVPAVPPPEEWQ